MYECPHVKLKELYNFVTKNYGLTEIGVITKNDLDISKRQWKLDTMDMSKTSFGHVQLSNIIKSNWTCPKDSPVVEDWIRKFLTI